jgi:ATP-binding cassette subfamily B protein
MEHYEDDESARRRVLSNTQVLAFIAGYWRRRPGMLAATVALMLIAIACELLVPQASQGLIDAAVAGPAHAAVAWRAWGFFVAIYLGFALLRNAAMRFWNPLAVRVMQEITNEGFARVQAFSADWHGDTFAGATVRRLSRAMWGYDVVADAVVIWIGPALLILVGLSAQMILRWPLVGTFSLVTVIAYIASNVVFSNLYVNKANQRSVAMDSRIGGALADSITSNLTVKSFGAEAREAARLGRIVADWRAATFVTWSRYTDVWLVQNLLLWGLQAGLTGLVIQRWAAGAASAGDVGFVITSFLVMSGYLRNIGENIRMAQRGLADVEDVARWSRAEPQVVDRPEARDLGAPALAARGPPSGESGGDLSRASGRIHGEIVFEDVTFRYKSARAPIYDGFSLRIAARERLALVGATGSGKSTFIKLIQRLYDVQAGRILIDGVDIAQVTQASLRRAIAVVPQDPALFHRTIAENIAYGRPDATSEEIILAARRARAHDFIAALPAGYDTLVGERGVRLSGGERQRVALARAFLADAPILVLDEATSSLDVETEAKVQAATLELMAGRTTIVIAHRLSTIRGADRILVFDHGRVVEQGRHGELVSLGGVYSRLNAVSLGAVSLGA